MFRKAAAVAGAIMLLAALATPAFAAKGGNGHGKGHATVVIGDGIAIDGDLTFGSQLNVTQTIITEPLELGRGPWIWLRCYITDILVLSDVRAGFPGGYGYQVPFLLGPTARWSGGSASCIVEVGHVDDRGGVIVDGSLAFESV